MSLPDVDFQQGPVGISCLCHVHWKREPKFLKLTKHESGHPASRGRRGTVFVKLFHSWRNGILISYELNGSVKYFSRLHVAWTLLCDPVQLEKRGSVSTRSSGVPRCGRAVVCL
ncbi:unnamed protein product [Rangifer tarandus platyrhynchus]|uniref:Uncharacterized protein n=2 Tax=Rangifer tarandus platyrhynchus TaxID=3082113 RepID=A0AC59ZM00_RANTA|nr:unnamed protein product [Rangifer tarandus platyrhynchus]